IDAKSLEEQVITGRTFNEAELKEIAEKILNILIDLHELKPSIIHRDIKPSNILLTNRSGNSVGEVYLVDFGSVQNITAVEGGTLTVVGTYGYMSPEHFGGRAVPTSDLYSLGATLIYLATGIHPADFPQKDLQIQFEDKTQLSQHFTNWLKKVLEPSREKRFDSAQMALEALQNSEHTNLSCSENLTIKPVDTKIILNRNVDKIEIIKPSIGWVFSSFETLISNIISTFFGLFFAILLSNFPLIGWFLSLMLICSGIFKWIDFLFGLFGTTQLVINQKKIYLAYELFGLRYERVKPSLRKNIIKLEYTNSFIQRKTNARGKFSYKEVSPAIIIWAGNKQYKLAGITQTEVEWLLNELGDCLQLPFQRRMIPIVKSED
ncbi:MAG: serine/threonine protein kinase, partial [Cyanobacteria bacterium J06573_2]